MAIGKVAAGKCGVVHGVNKRCHKLCHSSLVKLPFVKMSASWFLDSTYLIWTCGSNSILSNNQCLRKCTTVTLSQRGCAFEGT